MLQGAIIGIIVAIIMIIIRKNKEKKAIAKVMNEDLVDRPDFAAFFHCASQATFEKKGIKFFDSNGALTLNGSMLNYTPDQKNNKAIHVDLTNVQIQMAPEKRKFKWLEIDVDGEKFYLTTFVQNAFSVDKSAMEEFISRVSELNKNL